MAKLHYFIPILNVTEYIEEVDYTICLKSRFKELHLFILRVQYPHNILGFWIRDWTFLILTIIHIEIKTIKSRKIRSRVCIKLHGKPKHLSLRPLPIINSNHLFLIKPTPSKKAMATQKKIQTSSASNEKVTIQHFRPQHTTKLLLDPKHQLSGETMEFILADENVSNRSCLFIVLKYVNFV